MGEKEWVQVRKKDEDERMKEGVGDQRGRLEHE